MKTKLLVFVLLAFQFSSIAQNWECFPPNQKSYYRYTQWSGESIDLIVQDSTRNDSASNTLFFRRHELNPGAETCRQELLGFYEQSYYSYPFIDSLVQAADTIRYTYNNVPVYFLPKSNPGDTWNFTTYGLITISCDSIITDSVFGQVDSIKCFHTGGAMPVQQIRLSKSFGFLDFIPFYYFYNSSPGISYHLEGYEKNMVQQGFQPPHFFDFLPYHVGDILKWDYHVDGMLWNPTFHFTYRDSITQVDVYADSLIYIYDRTKVDSGNNVSYIPGQIKKFTRWNSGNLLDAPPNDLGIWLYHPSDSEAEIHYTSVFNIYPDTVLLDNLIERNFQWTNSNLRNDSSCTIVNIIDGISSHYSYNTHQGLVKEDNYGQSTNWYTTLVGATINGVTYGNPSLSVGIASLQIENILVFPNPCSERLNVKMETDEFIRIELLDLYGHMIFSQKWQRGNNEIDLSELPPSVYALRLVGTVSAVRMIVKQ